MLNIVEKTLSSLQLRQLEKFGDRVSKFGVNFAVCDANGKLVLLCDGGRFESSQEQLIEYSRKTLAQNGDICRFGEENLVLAVVMKSGSEAAGVALMDLGRKESVQSDVEYLSEILALFGDNFEAASKTSQQIDMVSTELAQVYEELVLLHKLSTNMKVSEPGAKYLQLACDSLTEIVNVGGIAIILEKTIGDAKQFVLAAGSGMIDVDTHMHRIAILYSRLVEQINNGKEALLDSEVDSPFKYNWPDDTRNIIAVPLWGKNRTESQSAQGGDNIIGFMVAINIVNKSDFDSIDVKLFNSVANSCAVFVENEILFSDLKELFIGSLKALTSSIDAKDQYTRGHSERVAFISRWIAERLDEQEPLREEQIHRIYLAGLLHDIGKIGVDEVVLCKEGKLTEHELALLRRHPSIGADILSGIKQMRDIVPGVLYHHERMDGRGYPKGLVDKQIPLIGKIIGLADSFDAMVSERTYRKARTLEQALAEIKKGLGTQFDEKIGRVFINSDIYQLWSIMQDGFAKVYGASDLSEYGAVAVGTLIR